jgi:pseudouridine kinase
MNGEHQVVVVGAAGLDMKVRSATQVIERHQSNPAHIRWGWGGVARNMAENLARLGADVQFISAVGDDTAGHNLLAQLHSVGIATDATLVMAGMKTSAYVGIHQEDERLWVAFDDMAIIQKIVPEHLEVHRELLAHTDLICIDANPSLPTLQKLFKLAREYEVPVCADPTTPMLAPRLHPFLPEIAALTPSLQEAEALLGRALLDTNDIMQGARTLAQQRGVGLAIITLGADGLIYATAEESGRLPPFEVELVDPVGTGDALTAAVAYGLLEDLAPSEAVRLGLAAAAQTLACQHTVCPHLSLESLYNQLIV